MNLRCEAGLKALSCKGRTHVVGTCGALPGCNARQGDTGHRMANDYHPLRSMVLYLINDFINAVGNTQSRYITYRIAMAW